ncbi:MAG: hypothetical protein CMJ18_21775 [Phycisphaeraceae bacterium]|nr:hypothetical protein [Phycisphaeraceae bacterium]
MRPAFFVIGLTPFLASGSTWAEAPQPDETRFVRTETLQGVGKGLSSWCDFDDDGDVDVMIDGSLYQNGGDGSFRKVDMGVGGPGVWGDFDNDGLVDFFRFSGEGTLWRQVESKKFEAVPFPGNPGPLMPRAAWADANNDGRLDLFVTNYEHPVTPNRFYLQNEDGTFAEPVNLMGKLGWSSRGADWGDFDNDGDQDLYVSNYRLMPNTFMVNRGRGTFAKQATARGVAGVADGGVEPASGHYKAYKYHGHTIGSCWGDLNNDGNLDLFVVNFSHPPSYQDRPQVLINSGPPNYMFKDLNVNAGAGIYWQESYAKGSLADYDNDGDLDIYITTVYGGDHGDLFRNDGTGRFTPVGDALSLRTGSSYQVSWADYDNDGDMDLLVDGVLFQNQGNANAWLKVKVVGGAGSNMSAIGARITLKAGERTQIREVSGGNSGNQGPLVQHFGLGNHDGEVEVSVRFPSGKVGRWTVQSRKQIVAHEREAE